MPTEQDFKVANRLALRAVKLVDIVINAKTIATKRQRIEEVVDAIDAAAHVFKFWKKGSKPILLDPPLKVDVAIAIGLLTQAKHICVLATQTTSTENIFHMYTQIIELAFLADENLRNWKNEK